LRLASTFPDTQAALQTSSFGVVICSSQLADSYCWKAVLTHIQRMPAPPQLIVADRLADDALWAEVLNLGCYDLLMTPFSAEEVLRVVPMAWDSWQRRFATDGCGPKPPKLAEPQRQSFLTASATGAD
jgi:DNA-binding NtrC family response regulator